MADYRLALQINPTYGEAHNNLGIELAMRGEIDEAIKCFRNATRFSPRLASAYSNLGMALARQGKAREALQQYQESLRLDADDARVHNNLANLLVSQGRADEAIAHYREALRLRSESPRDSFQLREDFGRARKTGRSRRAISGSPAPQTRLRPGPTSTPRAWGSSQTLSETQMGALAGAESWRFNWLGWCSVPSATRRLWLPGEATLSGRLCPGESTGMVRASRHFLISEWPSTKENPAAPP